MSAEEDTELRDLVAQTLETNGVLGKIRAQLRASVYLALEEQESVQNKKPFENADLQKFLSSKEGRSCASLVREFLEFFNLDFSLAVFDPESGHAENYEGRAKLARDLDIEEDSQTESLPLLAEVAKRLGGSSPAPKNTNTEHFQSNGTREEADLSPTQVYEARLRFEEYDKDNSGTIDKNELRTLFMDMFPDFHRSMLERYVNDEFRAADVDFSSAIDFEEFLGMYKRLFVVCRGTVSSSVNDLTHSGRKLPDPKSKLPIQKAHSWSAGHTYSNSASAGHSSVVDFKNKRNMFDKEPSKDTKAGIPDSPRSVTSDIPDDDSFFDDSITGKGSQLPSGPPTLPKPKVSHDGDSADGGNKGMSSLAGLPALNGGSKPVSNDSSKTADNDIKDIDKKIANLGLSVPEDDDYDDDFDSSNISPVGVTPRSARSDHNVQSIDEEIEEDIDDEDLSVADDLLKSDPSGLDDLTTDRTVSPADQSSAFDYIEEVNLP